MKTYPTISALRSDFRERVLDFLWRQWTQLGVSGAVDARDDWAIDPEVLLVHSVEFARLDPRLFDEILDWLVVNASTVSTQRLRNLLAADDAALVRASLSWAAAHGAAPLKAWQRGKPSTTGGQQPLFEIEGLPAHVEHADATFREFGLLRPASEPSRKSRPADPMLPANLAVRLRMFFGVGTRAEVVRLLLTMGQTSTGRLAESAGYARRNVSEALEALAGAGVIDRVKRGRLNEWRADPGQWSQLLGVAAFPGFVDWMTLFRVLNRIHGWLDNHDRESKSDYMRASSARQLLEDLEPDFVRIGLRFTAPRDVTTAVAALEKQVASVLEFVGPGRREPSHL